MKTYHLPNTYLPQILILLCIWGFQPLLLLSYAQSDLSESTRTHEDKERVLQSNHYNIFANVPSCQDDENEKFLFAPQKDNAAPKYKSCAWLAKRGENLLNRLCKLTDGDEVARNICRNTCNACESNVEGDTYEPTNAPSALQMSELTSSPTACFDNMKASFFHKYTNNQSKAINRSCKWLQKQNKRTRNNICSMISPDDKKLAREVCMDTCGTCGLTSASQTPTPLPTSAASEKPSIGLSEAPTTPPTSSRTKCFENDKAEFLFKIKNNNAVYKSCSWLQTRTQQALGNLCTSTSSSSGIGPAREVCMNTCNTCGFMNPNNPPTAAPTFVISAEPTLIQTTETPTTSPTSSPTTCFENNNAKFVLEMKKNANNELRPTYKTCGWLQSRNPNQIKNVCDRAKSFRTIGPASEVCMNTCGTCYRMDPSQAPSFAPTFVRPTAAPTFVTSAEPTLIQTTETPTTSPTSSPTTCFENNNAKFVLEMKKNANNKLRPTYKTCGWLQSRNPNQIKNVCARAKSFRTIGPASEVCMNTCGTCHRMDPSQAPSFAPTFVSTNVPSERSSNPSQAPSSAPSSANTNIPSWVPSSEPSESSSNPSLAPTSAPTLISSNSPSWVPSLEPSGKLSGAPTQHPSSSPIQPTSLPSSSPIQPTSTPSSSQATCVENSKDKFVLNLKSNLENDELKPVYKSCGWLQTRNSQQIVKTCASGISSMSPLNSERKARDICKSTCSTCIEEPMPSYKSFQIKTKLTEFVSMSQNVDWCLQAANLGPNAKLNVRKCAPSDPEANEKQTWFLDGNGQFRLVSHPARCIVWEGKKIMLTQCKDSKHPLVYNELDKSISIVKTETEQQTPRQKYSLKGEKSDTKYLVGLDPFRAFSRISLYKESDQNPSMYSWNIEYDS